MYPFSWTTSTFDIYDELDSSGCDIFPEQGLGRYDVNSILNRAVSAYPSSADATVHDIINIS